MSMKNVSSSSEQDDRSVILTRVNDERRLTRVNLNNLANKADTNLDKGAKARGRFAILYAIPSLLSRMGEGTMVTTPHRAAHP